MDKAYIAGRLKKYLFFISIIFAILTGSHLIYSYIYSDAKETAVKGGSISEAIIGSVPNLNPLKNSSEQNKYINTILYRSLLKYSISKKKIVGDITKCDISNLLEIECFLNENITWSNGESITSEDILKTFETLKSNDTNPIMSSLLKNTTITKTDTGIIFKNTKKDINFLKIFFQPIVSAKILNVISKKEMEGSFSLPNGIYSGKYKVTNLSKDETIGVTTITLERNNEYYKNPVYIDTVLFKVFPTVKDFLRHQNSINIFNDKDNLISGTVPRLQEHNYILPQYVSLFFNTKRIKESPLRALISSVIKQEDIVKELGEEKFQTVKNHYLTENSIEPSELKTTFTKTLNKKGYFSLEEIVKKFEVQLAEAKIGKVTPVMSGEAKPKIVSGEVSIAPKVSSPKTTIEKVDNPKSKVITSPNWVDKYNFISKNNVLLKGNVPAGTSGVFVNDYRLKGYTPGATSFSYRISLERATLKQGENNYKIYFEKQGEKTLSDEVNFYYSTNKETLKTKEKETLEKTVEIKTEKKETPITNSGALITNTGSVTTDIKASNLQVTLEKKLVRAKELDSSFVYNEELTAYTLELYYLSGKTDYKKTAEHIQKTLNTHGIKIELREISTQNLNTLLVEKKKNYDMLLAGVNLSYFDFNIYPYFHSSQIESGYNFSNFRKLDLDIVLEELKSKLLGEDKIAVLEKKALTIIEENHLAKTIYTPILSNLVDKNIKGYELSKNIPENIYRFEPLQKSYVKEEKRVITENKGIIGFIKYLFESLF
ncbi:ABC transporter substrate-binding protein [Candidatus Gracilibacteria bacterium]|nr:ABC transporter substrate-binding protein [Candidatus Gracilibacteria bacterium]